MADGVLVDRGFQERELAGEVGEVVLADDPDVHPGAADNVGHDVRDEHPRRHRNAALGLGHDRDLVAPEHDRPKVDGIINVSPPPAVA